MPENKDLIKKILKAKNLSDDDKADIIAKILEEKTTIYPTYPIIPWCDPIPCTPCTAPFYFTTTGDSTEINLTGTNVSDTLTFENSNCLTLSVDTSLTT